MVITNYSTNSLFVDVFDEGNNLVLADIVHTKKFDMEYCKLFMEGTLKTPSNQLYQIFIIHNLMDAVSIPL